MKAFVLDDLKESMRTNPELFEKIFIYTTQTGKYGPIAKSAINIPEERRKPTQSISVANARANYNVQIQHNQDEILEKYLTQYSADMNRRGWANGAKNATIAAGGGLVLLLTSFAVDSKVAKTLAEVGSTAGGLTAAYWLLKSYIVYKSPIKIK
jgi:hypothetical protein